MKKDFLAVNDFTKEELMDIINLSIAIKKSINSGYNPPAHEGHDARHDLPAVLHPYPLLV